MKWTACLCVLFLAACAPRPAGETPVPPSLQLFQSPTSSPTAGQPAGLVVSAETPLPTPTPFAYTVKTGDTLSQIAEKFNISLDALLAANPDVDPNAMSVGQTLQIPSNPTNQSSESTPTPVPFPVRQIACYPNADGGLWCFALVHNDSQDFIENVTAQFTLRDPDGKSLASQTALLPLNILPPDTSLPLSVYFAPEMPANARPQVQILTAIRLLPNDTRYLPATIDNTLVQVDWAGHSAQVSGQVLLPADSEPAKSIWVAAVAYDSAGRVIGVRRWESTANLAPGGNLPFSFLLSSAAGDISRVDFAVEARP